MTEVAFNKKEINNNLNVNFLLNSALGILHTCYECSIG